MIILIDGNYLANRAYHSVGHLTHKDSPTGVPFGMFVEAALLVDRFKTDRLVWCFDQGKSIRESVLPTYKASRKPDPTGDPEKYAQRVAVHTAVKDMATRVLPMVGYTAVWHAKGFEADDIIAAYCHEMAGAVDIVVVSADADLYQLLAVEGVALYNPQTKVLWDADAFEHKWGISPAAWAEVKAVAGCNGDDIPGVDGVAEKTAIQWLQGTLGNGKKRDAIEAAADLIEFNRSLVYLPWPGCPVFNYTPHTLCHDKWDAMRAIMGFAEAHVPMPVYTEGVDIVIERPEKA